MSGINGSSSPRISLEYLPLLLLLLLVQAPASEGDS
jgi:hypothetical protein